MIHDKHSLSPLERLCSLITSVRPGEGMCILLFSLYAFALLTSYHILKTIRETLLLTSFTPETRSYAVAVIAVLMLFLVPLYGVVFRNTRKLNLIKWLSLFFVANIGIFYSMGRTGQEIGFTYFVFVGTLGVVAIAQFWAFATDCFNVKSGQRIFPVIMIGAAGGGLAGAQLTKYLTGSGFLAPLDMMPIAAVVLLVTVFLAGAARSSVPVDSRCPNADTPGGETAVDPLRQSLGGFALVMRDRFLLLMAVMMVLLNWINTTGETVLAYFVSEFARAQAGASEERAAEIISSFYGDYFFWVNLIGFAAQTVLVARIYRWVGIRGALLVMPAIAVIGYGIMVFVPIFSIIRLVKIVENSADYSLMNTTRQALFLPTRREVKYEGKMAVDTFFWRFGDLLQAAVVFAGINWFGLGVPQFALLNLLLALVWLLVAVLLGMEYRRLVRENPLNQAPELKAPFEDVHCPPGAVFDHTLATDAFIDADPGDILNLRARLANGQPLPPWLRFHAPGRSFRGLVPQDVGRRTEIEVIAEDFEGLTASGTLVVWHGPADPERGPGMPGGTG